MREVDLSIFRHVEVFSGLKDGCVNALKKIKGYLVHSPIDASRLAPPADVLSISTGRRVRNVQTLSAPGAGKL
jgi:hypothetical protein